MLTVKLPILCNRILVLDIFAILLAFHLAFNLMLHVTLLFNIQMNMTLCPILVPVKFHKVRRYYQQLDYLHSSFLPFVLSLLSFWVLFFTAFVSLWWISSLNLLILVTWGTSFPNAVDGDVVWIVFSVTLAVSILFLRTSGVTKQHCLQI